MAGKPTYEELERRVAELEKKALDQRRVEETLRETVDSLQLIMDAAPDSITITRVEDGRYLEVNEAFCRLSGYSREEALGRTPIELNLFVNPSDREGFVNAVKDKRELRDFDIQYRMRDGVIHDTILSARPVTYRGEECLIAIVTAITERKRSEEALRVSEERYRNILESIEDGYFEVDIKGNFRFFNDSTARIIGYSASELMGINYKQYMDEENAKKVFQTFNRVYTAGDPVRAFDWEVIRKDGTRRYVDASVSLIRDIEGFRLGFRGIVRDVTERKQVEKALRESEERFRSAFEGANISMCLMDLDGGITRTNNKMCEILGYDKKELERMTVNDITHPEDLAASPRFIKQAASGGIDHSQFEKRYVHKQGHIVWGQVSISLVKDINGDPLYFISHIQDITERKLAEEALRQSEERFRMIFEAGPLGMAFLSPQDEFLDVNDAFCRMIGYSKEELIGLNYLDITHLNDLDASKESARKLLSGELPYLQQEKRYVTKDGRTLWINLTGSFVRDNMGKPLYKLTMIEDITKRKEGDEALKESENRFRSITENAADFIFIKDEARRYIFVNRSMRDLLRLDEREVLGKTPEEVFGAEQGRVVSEVDSRSFSGETVNETRSLSIGDKKFFFNTIQAPLSVKDGKVVSIMGIVRDVSEIMRAEEKLRESEARYRSVFENAGTATLIIEEDNTISMANPEFEKLSGYPREDVEGKMAWTDFVAPEDRERMMKYHVERRKKNGRAPNEYEFLFLDRDGNAKHIYNKVGMIPGTKKSVASHTDVTMRKLAEEERVRLNTAIEQAAETILITDTSGSIQYVNPAFEHVTGYARGDAIGENPRILKSGKHSKAFYEDLWQTLNDGRTWSGHFINRKKDGILYEEEATISPVLDSSGKIINYVAVKRDVTNEVRLEEQFRQAQKMEAVGTLAGGIAHDFNNLLQAIMGYTQMLMMSKERGDPELGKLGEIEKASQRARVLTQQLLAFSRKVESELRPVDLNREVLQVEKLLTRIIPKMIGIELHLEKDLGAIQADPAQIEQIIMNLGVNARDAMPEGGRLIFETGNVILDEGYCKIHLGAVPGEYVLLTISDTGHGMEKETLEHIFEPFYTTKETGKGTGLGLSMVYGIVKSHGGHIMCYSEQGKGTTFKVFFPAIQTESMDERAKREEEKELPGGRETILLVDDEELLLALGKEMLERFGYTVLTADRGEKALEIYRREREEISLVIMDLVMPGMGGRKCLEQILKMDPSQKIVIASGYSLNGQAKAALESGAEGYMRKPYELREMLSVIRDALDR